MTEDPDRYSRTEYRRLIGWKSRLEREAPFLESLLDRAPERSVLDFGCGTGEHTAHFAGLGCRSFGLDSSPSMIEKARSHEQAGHGRFVLGDMVRCSEALKSEPPFGLGLCLGNVLPHLLEEAELDAFLTSVSDLLLPGGLFLLQILNYAPLLSTNIRHLPLHFRPGDKEPDEIIFLRILRHVSHQRIHFFPTTLLFDPEAEEPIRVHSSRRVEQHPWRAEDLLPLFAQHHFQVELHGNMQGGPFLPDSSQDLVLLATKSTP